MFLNFYDTSIISEFSSRKKAVSGEDQVRIIKVITVDEDQAVERIWNTFLTQEVG